MSYTLGLFTEAWRLLSTGPDSQQNDNKPDVNSQLTMNNNINKLPFANAL